MTKKERSTRRAKHMEKYVVIHPRRHYRSMSLVIGSQSFDLVVLGDGPDEKPSKDHLIWVKDMLCIALAELVRMEHQK